MRSSRCKRATIAKYSWRSYGSFRMWKSRLDSPTHPKQYVHPLQPTLRTRYALPTQRSHSTQCWHARHDVERAQWLQSVQSAHDTQ